MDKEYFKNIIITLDYIRYIKPKNKQGVINDINLALSNNRKVTKDDIIKENLKELNFYTGLELVKNS